jgi:hypothetical protein
LNDAEIKSGGTKSAGPVSASIAQAEAYDAAGDHMQAIDCLAAAARKHDVEALTRLGKRLLIGDRAPRLPIDGARLLEDADVRGGAEAAATLSVLYAVGASPQKGLSEALEKLTVAAERAWIPAQQQLRVLAADLPGGASPTHGSSGNDWRALASSVDLSAWQEPPRGRDLCKSPLVRVIPGFVNDRTCQWLIERARGRLTRALVYEALSRKTTVRATRTNTAATLNLLDTDLVCVLVQARISRCLDIPFRHLEAISVLHYAEGEEITEHYDFVDPKIPNYRQEIATNGQRVVTFLVYLNDDYAGGETEFPELSISHRGRCGEALFFVNALADGSADERTLHAGRSTTNGDKWVVSQFVRNRPMF